MEGERCAPDREGLSDKVKAGSVKGNNELRISFKHFVITLRRRTTFKQSKARLLGSKNPACPPPAVSFNGKWEHQCPPHKQCCKIQPSMLACDLANMASEAKSCWPPARRAAHRRDGRPLCAKYYLCPPCRREPAQEPAGRLPRLPHDGLKKPPQWVEPVATACVGGGSRYCFHLESMETDDLDAVGMCKLIRENGMQVGIALKPGTAIRVSWT